MELVYQRMYKYIPEREIFELSDGGLLALDWFYAQDSEGKTKDKETSTNPLIILIPGLTGDHTVLYMISTLRAALKNHYDCVVVNYRGLVGVPLKVHYFC